MKLWERYVKRIVGKRRHTTQHIRAELNRLARQVRKIRKEVERPKGAIDAGYKTALTDVLALIEAAKR